MSSTGHGFGDGQYEAMYLPHVSPDTEIRLGEIWATFPQTLKQSLSPETFEKFHTSGRAAGPHHFFFIILLGLL